MSRECWTDCKDSCLMSVKLEKHGQGDSNSSLPRQAPAGHGGTLILKGVHGWKG